MLVEVCANSLQSALNAEKAGADRIELCSELAVGGITASYGFLKAIRKAISVPVNVLIRPRGGDFSYSESDFSIMKQNVELCTELGFNGIVSGVLNTDFSVDLKRTETLMRLAGDLEFTFHRAFDWVKDPQATLFDLEQLGVHTILTSGQKNKAIDGIDLLTALHEKAEKCTIMPGSGINSGNVNFFKRKGFRAIHLSGVKMHMTLDEQPKVPMSTLNMLSDVSIPISNVEAIREVVKSVK